MAEAAGGLARGLARKRVPLGFLASALTLALARPTWITWSLGSTVALVGECIRIWAAGHLNKGREVTRSGPYRFTGHRLYAGSTVIAGGVAIAGTECRRGGRGRRSTWRSRLRRPSASRRWNCGGRSGLRYDDYRSSRAAPMDRRFSLRRAIGNREHRAVAGLLGGFALLALKMLGTALSYNGLVCPARRAPDPGSYRERREGGRLAQW